MGRVGGEGFAQDVARGQRSGVGVQERPGQITGHPGVFAVDDIGQATDCLTQDQAQPSYVDDWTDRDAIAPGANHPAGYPTEDAAPNGPAATPYLQRQQWIVGVNLRPFVNYVQGAGAENSAKNRPKGDGIDRLNGGSRRCRIAPADPPTGGNSSHNDRAIQAQRQRAQVNVGSPWDFNNWKDD